MFVSYGIGQTTSDPWFIPYRIFEYLIVLYGACLSKCLFTILRKWARALFALAVRQKSSQLSLTRSALNLIFKISIASLSVYNFGRFF